MKNIKQKYDVVIIGSGFGGSVSALRLAEKGYKTIPHSYDFGDVQVIMRNKDSWIAASDPRDRGDSRVFEVTN